MPLIQSGRFNSPWNPFWPPGSESAAAVPGMPGMPGAATDQQDWGDLSSGYGSGVSAGPELAPPFATAADAAAAQDTAAQTAANAASGNVAVAGVALPAALQQNGSLTPRLTDLLRDREYGWNAASERLFRRFERNLAVSRHLGRRAPNTPTLMPPDAIRINEGGSFAIAADTPSGLYTVFTWRVPPGYYGWLNYASHEYTGGGFAEASGGLIWHIQVNDWFFPGYGAIRWSLGSRLAGLWNIANGLPLIGNQYISYLVDYDSTSTVVPGGSVICTIQGWRAPVRKMRSHHGGT